MQTKQATVYTPIRLSARTNEQLDKLCATTKRNKSEVIRSFIDKGLQIDGYKQDEEMLKSMIEEAVTKSINPLGNRLAAMTAKTGWVSAGAYFLLIYTLRILVPEKERPDIDHLAHNARRLGIEYLVLMNF
ncbi:MAG: hypothetical protein RR263_00245 [Oscillospiraceae bacterium]